MTSGVEFGTMIPLAMNSFTSRSVLFSLVTSVALTLAPQVGAQQADGTVLATQETARRQQAMRDAMQKVQEARTAYTEGRYGVAVDCYRAALEVVPEAPATEKQVKFIKDSLADALVAKGMDYRKVGRTDEAVEFLKEAMQVSPGHKFAAHELSKTQDPAYTNPALTPRHVGNVEEVSRLLNLAYGYYDLGNFDKAEETFNSVLKIDAYNTAAQRGKELVQNRKAAYSKTAYDAYRAKALTEVDKMWEEPKPQDGAVVGQVTTGEAGAVIHQDMETESSIAAALKEMVIPQIVFEDATIKDVVETLQGQISRFTAQGITANRNINVVTDFGPADSEAYKTIMSRTVSLNLSNISVSALLDILDKQLGIKHYITPLGVELSFSGRDFGPMVERVYTLPPHFFDAKEEVEDEEEDEDDFMASGSGVRVKRLNPVQALKSMGISFPEGSRARYDSGSRLLTVHNTVFNHEEIEELISVPSETDKAVVLNIIAMEIDETDLNELGFEWMFNFNIGPKALFGAGGEKTSLAELAGLPTFETQVDLPNYSYSATQGLRSGTSVFSADNVDELIRIGRAGAYSAASAVQGKAPGIFSFRGVWGSGDVMMLMRGAAQKKGADIMTNPRLLITPGRDEQVVFANVDEMYVPESYSEPEVSDGSFSLPGTGSSSNNNRRYGRPQGFVTIARPAHPTEFSRFAVTEDGVGGVGSVVQVHSAEVEAGGQFVTLALTVTMNELEGFVNWGTPIYSVMKAGNSDVVEKLMISENRILQPIFKRSLENTKITVGSGSVLVIGGLKEAKTVKYEDKLPGLGDLPLVGRLFRSEGEEKVRKAFLMFVKVDIVDPTGRNAETGIRPQGMME